MPRPLEETRERLQSLIEISQLLVSAMEPDEVVSVILDSATKLFDAEGCSLALVDEAAQELVFVAMEGPAKAGEFRIAIGQGIAGWVMAKGRGVVCNDVSRDPRFYGGVDKRTGYRTQSILCAPLKQRDQTIGVIESINTTKPGGFTQDDLDFLIALGGLAGTALTRTRKFAQVRDASAALQQIVQDRYRLVTGESRAMGEVLRLARTVAATDTTVLLMGESGTGKEVVARAIHQWSARSAHPFMAINCVALTPELLASELFGHEKGAFTGAASQKKGKFELADGGTIFLDEIGDLASDLQAKLLRALQDKEFQRVGGVKDIRANVRILAASNRDLREAMHKGIFRDDLFYRLNVVSVTMPPLRDRLPDIPQLVRHFLDQFCREVNRSPMGMTRDAMELLQSYAWPGNVRELQNAIERAVVLSSDGEITVQDFPAEIRHASMPPDVVYSEEVDNGVSLADSVKQFKRTRLLQALEAAHGNQNHAAKILGLQPSNLSRLMHSLGLR